MLSGRLLFYLKKRKISWNGHSLTFAVTRCTTRCHSLSLVVIFFHSLSLVVTRCNSLYRCTTRCHSLSFVVPLVGTRCHSLPLVVTRCTTRLPFYKRSITPDAKLPIVINRNHYLVKLIVSNVHLKLKRAGCKQILIEIRQKFWITQARQFVRNIIRKYVIFRKLHAKSYFCLKPTPLNELRLRDKRTFSTIGIGNFGPLLVKNVYDNANDAQGLGHMMYVCFYNNVILDLRPSLSANSLKNSLKRFVSRRGCPDKVISDNDSNFVAIETKFCK